MPTIPYAGFIGPAYQSTSYMQDDERCVNFFPEQGESPNAPAPWVLLPTPGYETLYTPSQAPGRGSFSENGRVWFVAGFALYEFFEATNTAILRGSVQADANPVTFSSNGAAGHQLFITSGDVGYLLDTITNALSIVLPSGATMGDYLDGYFLCLDATTSTWRISNLLDGLTWNPAAIAQRTAGSDRWVALCVCNRLIYLLGEQTSEVWYNAGNFPFPFAPIQEAFMEQGCSAPWSVAVLESDSVGSVLWVTGNSQGGGTIVRTQGYTPGRVSTHAIEAQIHTYADASDAIAWGYQEGGHPCYVLTFPTGDQTWVYDGRTGLWHERAYWNTATGLYQKARALWFAATSTQNLALDIETGSIYAMSTSLAFDVDGSLIRRMRQPPRLSINQKRFTVNSLQVVMDVGQGLSVGQGSDPVCMLKSSRDAGRTWGHERWTTAGKIGAYSTRVRWTRLGQARNRVDQFVMTDPVPYRLCGAEIDLTVGTS